MANEKKHNRMSRRDVLTVGTMGSVGLSLSGYLQLADAGHISALATAKHGIFIHLQGGPSHIDTFDMKPNAPSEYRGPFHPIATNLPSVSICQHLPKLAQCADKYAIVRGVSHTLGAHELGSQYVATGTRPLPSIDLPTYGAVVNKESQHMNPRDLPSFVSVGTTRGYQRPGFLGVRHGPLDVAAPRANRPFRVRGISFSKGTPEQGAQRRRRLMKSLDKEFEGFESDYDVLDGLDRFSQQAHDIIQSPRTRDAFDIRKETPSFSKPFGEEPFGQSCLMATRLIESGVRFVSIETPGWDTHEDNFNRLKDTLLPRLDTGLSSLFTGLEQKGLLQSTAVLVTGEFGRTPKINSRSVSGGRDHYPRCMFMLLAGGGISAGQVVGKSNDRATLPANQDEGFSPDDVAATFYHVLGIDHTKEYHTRIGRPITIVRDGNPIRQLLA